MSCYHVNSFRINFVFFFAVSKVEGANPGLDMPAAAGYDSPVEPVKRLNGHSYFVEGLDKHGQAKNNSSAISEKKGAAYCRPRTVSHTKTDPILSPYFVSLCDTESLFELDAVSHEMQRHRMTIGVFYP